jgi:hypothetical protein
MLTLDHSTLFYWTLSDTSHNKRKCCSTIKAWASALPTNSYPISQVTSKSISSHIPSLTDASHSSAPSILTDDVKIITHQPASDLVKVKPEPGPILSLTDAGSLSDNDEMRGDEQDAVINSPPKGKRQVISKVNYYSLLIQ